MVKDGNDDVALLDVGDDAAAPSARTLATYKRPTAIHFRDELPRGPLGKVRRRDLR